jgi:hypothetical protein
VHCRPVLKLFDVDNNEYLGKVLDIDSEIEDEDGTVLRGIWFRIL